MQMKSWLQRTISISKIKFKKSLCFYCFRIAKVNKSFMLKKKEYDFLLCQLFVKKLKGEGE